ncbi:succinate dehydrogenase, cytochrome b556 subunit [Afifella pfennigii]|uniref:succinate dehydrogenase, cytochrome b556 subunit n=1 Tax=Afifella pfennigii TaxID=209897 RepID=UPI00047C863D|nr:succinate dehydrogenase, cytochrome b556 subunit [Afifella pfennigii]
MSGHRRHQAYWAFIGHRLSGLALAAFLPLHFLALALALQGAAALDEFLALADMSLFKLAEWGLVVLLAVHLFFGARLLFLELHPWKRAGDSRLGWIVPSLLAAFLIGAVFAVRVV